MAAPRKVTKYTLNPLKGWPSPAAVDFTAKFASTLANTLVPPGACVSLNSSGEYILGVGNKRVMPMFVFANSTDSDIVNDGGDASTDAGVFIPIAPTGQAMALPANGAYELTSTHYVTGQSYTPNTHLTSPRSGGNEGKLTPATFGTNTTVGIVSRGIVDNGYGHPAVAFWPWYIAGDNT